MLKVVYTVDEMASISKENHRKTRTIGLVPTMGALHKGHLSLIHRACELTDCVVVSIFVNPLQFGPQEDYTAYPRDFASDLSILENEHVDIVFSPSPETFYPEGFSTFVSVEGLTDGMCGRSRPGHFRGVTTVVAKIFNVVQPDVAVFGQKDAQQLVVIRRMVEDLNMPVQVESCPIVREPDGLAVSSRNRYMNQEERRQAIVLSQSLQKAASLVKSGERRADAIIAAVREILTTAPSARIDYIELVDTTLLKPVSNITDSTLLALAVYFGRTRLIDNIILSPVEGKNLCR